MIMLLDDAYQVVETVHTEEELFLYLKENFRTMDEQAEQNWRFAKYSHKLLALVLQEMQGEDFAHMAWQACQQENDLIVMCKGDGENPSLFLDTPDLDVAALRKEWCRLFCKAHNLLVLTG